MRQWTPCRQKFQPRSFSELPLPPAPQRTLRQLRKHVAKFPVWMESDLISFTERHPSRAPNHYIQEQPDFFLSVA